LGRIEDPKKSRNTELNIINDPAFRILMVIGIKRLPLKGSANKELNLVIQNLNNTIVKTLNKFNGSIVKQKPDYFLTSFDCVTNAVLCAMSIQTMLNRIVNNTRGSDVNVSIGLSAGVPVTERKNIFEDTIKTAERLCNVVKGQIVISSEVKDLYESENLNISIDKKTVHALSLTEERFLNILMDYVDREWKNTTLNIDRFIKDLGYSKSKLYRSMIPITGKSPNTFIKEYRLNKALQLLNNQAFNISEIAFETGFNSPTYFTRAFKKQFGLLPTNFAKGSKTS
jgi:AraC-like DNA-binding protein